MPRDQISYIMGHRKKGDSPTTEIYARFKPDHCAEAVAAIESVLDEVQKKVRTINLRDPADAIAQLAKRRTFGSKLSKGEQDQLRQMIASGMRISAIAKHFNVTTTSVYKHRDKMRRNQGKAS